MLYVYNCPVGMSFERCGSCEAVLTAPLAVTGNGVLCGHCGHALVPCLACGALLAVEADTHCEFCGLPLETRAAVRDALRLPQLQQLSPAERCRLQMRVAPHAYLLALCDRVAQGCQQVVAAAAATPAERSAAEHELLGAHCELMAATGLQRENCTQRNSSVLFSRPHAVMLAALQDPRCTPDLMVAVNNFLDAAPVLAHLHARLQATVAALVYVSSDVSQEKESNVVPETPLLLALLGHSTRALQALRDQVARPHRQLLPRLQHALTGLFRQVATVIDQHSSMSG